MYPLPWDRTKAMDMAKFFLLKRAFKEAVKGHIDVVLRSYDGQEILQYKVVKATAP
jgi:hypothetical protein